ncbi:MAG TPA: DUF3806 domain-containing protein [Verrucomicrobiae bacterium]|nr:DUF3806 domain-containing protein [Verrucomicrobiae bacterium]
MLPPQPIALARLLLDVPAGFSCEFEGDGTVAAIPDDAPDRFTLRFSILTVSPEQDAPNPTAVDLVSNTLERGKAEGLKTVRAGDKAWYEEEKFSEENGVPIWLRFWVVGFQNYQIFISLCCSSDAKDDALVAEACSEMPQIIATIRDRPPTSALTQIESDSLNDQRALILDLLRDRYDAFQAPKLRSDLIALQRIIDDRVFSPEQEYEWTCLGVAFGDVLANELDLEWVIQCDEYGVEPALNLADPSITLYPRTMLLKRVENGETPDVSFLFEKLSESVEQLRRDPS